MKALLIFILLGAAIAAHGQQYRQHHLGLVTFTSPPIYTCDICGFAYEGYDPVNGFYLDTTCISREIQKAAEAARENKKIKLAHRPTIIDNPDIMEVRSSYGLSVFKVSHDTLFVNDYRRIKYVTLGNNIYMISSPTLIKNEKDSSANTRPAVYDGLRHY